MGKRKPKRTEKSIEKREDRDISPFASIVLKEKKEDKKAPEKIKAEAPKEVKKAPGEIVKGYDPNASFEDILYSFEHTGNPYTLKKSSFKGVKKNTQSNFGDILNKWENSYRKKDASQDNKDPINKKSLPREEKEPLSQKSPKSSYVPTCDFGKILEEAEKISQKKSSTPEKETKEKRVEIKTLDTLREEDAISNNAFFKSESDDEKRSERASWSILGGNEAREREALDLPPLEYKSPHRAKEEREEEKIAIEEKSSEALAHVVLVPPQKKKKKKRDDALREEDALTKDFYKKDGLSEERAEGAVWSIIGGNDNFERKENSDLPPIEKVDFYNKGSRSKNKRGPVEAKRDFQEILSEFDKISQDKTFEEILKEKDLETPKVRQYTITELRKMNPQATLDLHGDTKKEADEKVRSFIKEAQSHHLRKIAINVGKGLHSEDGKGVLKDYTVAIIDEMKAASEINPAPIKMGGSGVLWIILKEKE